MLKKLHHLMLFIGLLALSYGCNSGDSDPVDSCAKITSLEAEQVNSKLNINISAVDAVYFDISMVPVNAGASSPDVGIFFTFASAQGSINLYGNIAPGEYLLYARSACSDTNKSRWFGPKYVTITEFCATPTNLQVAGGTVSWYYYGEQASNFQVQYGQQGFALGNGTVATVNAAPNELYYTDAAMVGGQLYDFYVRAFCSNNIGFGDWEGPFTYYAEYTQNMCFEPSDIQPHYTYVDSQTRFVYFSWQGNGELQFQYALVKKGEDINQATLSNGNITNSATYTVSVWFDYDFYVRGVCANGNKTAWVKKEINP
ncbi:hypothetical protein [Flavobacterium sp. MK4S-17]|uniref:hypothetical protein n=1 Tax=Flavobacterium sp. MK4S-17 TaxID=2543737 RepID=UPI00135939B0|nr:hypothetical protein [Flavobacterium sp. MK4S-17]